jgi:hypothetical protein
LLEWLKKLFRTLHDRNRYTPGGFAVAMERIKKGFLNRFGEHRIMRWPENWLKDSGAGPQKIIFVF